MVKKKKKKSKKKGRKEEEKDLSEDERYNKMLKNFLIGVGIVALIIIAGYLIVQSFSVFEVQGVTFDVKKFCDSGPCLVTYHTTLPVIHDGKKATYNFYLRNDPRKLIQEVPFNGDFKLGESVAVKITYNNHCQGYETIATENLLNLHRVSGISVVNGQNATCESSFGDSFILIQEANETSVVETSQGCYVINVNECEILEGTERFMVEMFIEINRYI